MWDELGIAPCDDPKAIRRAYAARLKLLDPDREPDAFARLRQAYERALDASRHGGPARALAQQGASPTNDADSAAVDLVASDLVASDLVASDIVVGATRASARAAVEEDDIRDRALLIALDAALREGNAREAIALYCRAAATGALPLAHASDRVERLLAVALDDTALNGADFRHLIRIVGLDASRARAPVSFALRARALARLAAEDWYDDVLAKAQRKRGKIARRQRKIARLLIGRIGHYWHPRVDTAALRTWLAQYHSHAAWLSGRIDPAWIKRIEGRLRRRQIAWLVFYIFFIGGMLAEFMLLAVFGGSDDDAGLWPLAIGSLLIILFSWILILLVNELLKLLFPGWTGFGAIMGPRDLARSGRALWERLRARAKVGWTKRGRGIRD